MTSDEFAKKHPFVFLVVIGLSMMGIGLFLSVLVFTAIIGIPLMILGFMMIGLGIFGGIISTTRDYLQKGVNSYAKEKN